jgi:hypothetical protein
MACHPNMTQRHLDLHQYGLPFQYNNQHRCSLRNQNFRPFSKTPAGAPPEAVGRRGGG